MVDDLIVYLHGPDDVLLVPNAANAAEVLGRLAAEAPGGRHGHRPARRGRRPGRAGAAGAAGARAAGPARRAVLHVLRDRYRRSGGAEVTVCRTGYTGEHGYELLVDADRAGELWDALLEAGQDLGIRPCGLGARDTLRTEMGYPLHGHELSHDITPMQARAGWAVGWKKPAFWGREALLAEKEAGPRAAALGPAGDRAGASRAPGMAVLDAAGERVGEVTSGTFSPTLRPASAWR